jgi:hypothetical protein
VVVAHQEVGEMIDDGDSFGCPHFFVFKKTPECSSVFLNNNYFLLSIPPPRTIFISERITANTRAVKNPSRWKPGTIRATKSTIKILINRENKPRVSIVSGRVRILRIIQIVLLTTASTTATMIAVRYPSTEAPGVM